MMSSFVNYIDMEPLEPEEYGYNEGAVAASTMEQPMDGLQPAGQLVPSLQVPQPSVTVLQNAQVFDEIGPTGEQAPLVDLGSGSLFLITLPSTEGVETAEMSGAEGQAPQTPEAARSLPINSTETSPVLLEEEPQPGTSSGKRQRTTNKRAGKRMKAGDDDERMYSKDPNQPGISKEEKKRITAARNAKKNREEKKEELADTKKELEATKKESEAKDKKLEAKDMELMATKLELEGKDKELMATKLELEAKEKELMATKLELEATKMEMEKMKSISAIPTQQIQDLVAQLKQAFPQLD